MAEVTECTAADRDEFWQDTIKDVTGATETSEQAGKAPVARLVICPACDAVRTTGLMPADQAERELRAYLAAVKDEQEDK